MFAKPFALIALLISLLLGCAKEDSAFAPVEFERPETFVDYDVSLEGVSDDDVRALLEKSLALYRLQEKGAQSVAFLRRRATGDVETVQKILRAFGWFEARVKIDVDPPAEGAEDAKALARVIVNERRRYTLKSHQAILSETGDGAPPAAPDLAALGSPVGGPAEARGIVDAEDAAIDELRAGGRPYAARVGRDSVADPETAEILIATEIAAGASYVFGDAVYQGGEGVNRSYIDTYRTWTPGEPANPERLKAFQDELIATGLFNAVAADFPEEPPEGDAAPVVVEMEEADHRTVSGGVRYDTEAGPAVRAGFEHRNLFGANETLTLEALAGLETQTLGAGYRLPQWRRPGQDLVFGLELRRVDDEAFDELGATAAVGIERELTDEITVGFGLLGEVSRTRTIDTTETAKLAGLPVYVAYDSSDDRLDPTKGLRARLAVTPFAGVQGDTPVSFGVLDASASTYFDLTGEKNYILALRTRLATIPSGDIDVVSPSRRLYAGGGGSVRGYGERYIGPLDADGEPSGGRSAVEVGAEFRARLTEEIGGAVFVEGASVSEDVAPTFDEGFLLAVGGGVRYFSPVGPIRLDVGFPVNGRNVDDFFEFYISIGQAF